MKVYHNLQLMLLIFAKAKTQHNTGLTLVFAINYGGRAEIIQSMKAIYNELQLNGQGSEVIDEALISVI